MAKAKRNTNDYSQQIKALVEHVQLGTITDQQRKIAAKLKFILSHLAIYYLLNSKSWEEGFSGHDFKQYLLMAYLDSQYNPDLRFGHSQTQKANEVAAKEVPRGIDLFVKSSKKRNIYPVCFNKLYDEESNKDIYVIVEANKIEQYFNLSYLMVAIVFYLQTQSQPAFTEAALLDYLIKEQVLTAEEHSAIKQSLAHYLNHLRNDELLTFDNDIYTINNQHEINKYQWQAITNHMHLDRIKLQPIEILTQCVANLKMLHVNESFLQIKDHTEANMQLVLIFFMDFIAGYITSSQPDFQWHELNDLLNANDTFCSAEMLQDFIDKLGLTQISKVEKNNVFNEYLNALVNNQVLKKEDNLYKLVVNDKTLNIWLKSFLLAKTENIALTYANFLTSHNVSSMQNADEDVSTINKSSNNMATKVSKATKVKKDKKKKRSQQEQVNILFHENICEIIADYIVTQLSCTNPAEASFNLDSLIHYYIQHENITDVDFKQMKINFTNKFRSIRNKLIAFNKHNNNYTLITTNEQWQKQFKAALDKHADEKQKVIENVPGTKRRKNHPTQQQTQLGMGVSSQPLDDAKDNESQKIDASAEAANEAKELKNIEFEQKLYPKRTRKTKTHHEFQDFTDSDFSSDAYSSSEDYEYKSDNELSDSLSEDENDDFFLKYDESDFLDKMANDEVDSEVIKTLLDEIDVMYQAEYTLARNRFDRIEAAIFSDPEKLLRLRELDKLALQYDITYFPALGNKLLKDEKDKKDNLARKKAPWPLNFAYANNNPIFQAPVFATESEEILPLAQFGVFRNFPLMTKPEKDYLFTRSNYYNDRQTRYNFFYTYYVPVIKKTKAAAKALLVLFSHVVDQVGFMERFKEFNSFNPIAFIANELRNNGLSLPETVRSELLNIMYDLTRVNKKNKKSLHENITNIINAKADVSSQPNEQNELCSLPEAKQEADQQMEIDSKNESTRISKIYVKIIKPTEKEDINQKFDTTSNANPLRGDVDIYNIDNPTHLIASMRVGTLYKSENAKAAIAKMNKYAFATDKKLIEHNGSRRADDITKNGKKFPTSASIGFLATKQYALRMSSFLTTHPHSLELYSATAALGKENEKLYQEILPDEYNQLSEELSPHDALLLPDNKITSAVAINFKKQTFTHVDDNQLVYGKDAQEKKYSAINIFHGGNSKRYTGGYLVFTHCRLPNGQELAFDIQEGDQFIGDFSQLHHNTKIEALPEYANDDEDFLRISEVFYAKGDAFKKDNVIFIENSASEGEQDLTKKEYAAKRIVKAKQKKSDSFTLFNMASRVKPNGKSNKYDKEKNEALAEKKLVYRNREIKS